jgi:hypothetical protein
MTHEQNKCQEKTAARTGGTHITVPISDVSNGSTKQNKLAKKEKSPGSPQPKILPSTTRNDSRRLRLSLSKENTDLTLWKENRV